MTRYVEAPNEFDGVGASLFLAGGITNCPDWQSDMKRLLEGLDVTLLNPRRSTSIDWADDIESKKQVKWEFRHLRMARAILFWFPAESVCPIALYELGAWSMTSTPLFVGVHPNYPRRRDIEWQTAFVRPELTVHTSLADLAEAVHSEYLSIAPEGRFHRSHAVQGMA